MCRLVDSDGEASRRVAAEEAVKARFEELMAQRSADRAQPVPQAAGPSRWADLREMLILGVLLVVATAAVVAFTMSRQGDSCEPNPDAGPNMVDEICTDSNGEPYYR